MSDIPDIDSSNKHNNISLAQLHQIYQLCEGNTDQIYDSLETLCICFPSRISGSDNLEKSLDYLYQYGRKFLPEENCHEEHVNNVPCWNRGNDYENNTLETCFIDILPNTAVFPEPFPLRRYLRILANGLSVGTTKDGISGEVIVIESWDQLIEYGSAGLIQQKIVLYDFKSFSNYSDHSMFRNQGCNRATEFGAIGVLVRTLAPNNTTSGPHTGTLLPYSENTPENRIPSACIAIEDCELITRLIKRGHILKVTLILPCFRLADKISRNLVFEIKGTDFPNEVVIVGGHTDCWDCQCYNCQGAYDDGQGVVLALEMILLLFKFGLKPRRTIRAVLFADEELCQAGAKAYCKQHFHEASNGDIVAALETDMGVGLVCGFGFSGSKSARNQLEDILSPLSDLAKVVGTFPSHINESNENWNGNGVDIVPLINECNVPGLMLRHEDSWWFQDYFHFHHTSSDTIDHVDKQKLLLNFQILTLAVWILANSDEKLVRSNQN